LIAALCVLFGAIVYCSDLVPDSGASGLTVATKPESEVETTLLADGDSQWHRDSNSGGEPSESGFGGSGCGSGDRSDFDPNIGISLAAAASENVASENVTSENVTSENVATGVGGGLIPSHSQCHLRVRTVLD
jgi:hypothetical protein